MRFYRNSTWFFPLIIILTYPLWSIPIGNFLSPRGGIDPPIKSNQADNHNFNMDMVKILQNQNGKTTAFIKAHKAHTADENPNLFIMELVSADLFDEDGNKTNIIANKGTYSTIDKILTLQGDVVINKTEEKQFLYTDLLHYDSEKRIVSCPGKTRLEAEEVEIDGGSLRYEIKTRTYLLDNRVKCTIKGFVRP